MFKKKVWPSITPPLRVYKLKKQILLCTTVYDNERYWLYDGNHFRAADSPSNSYWDGIFKMYPDYFEEITKGSWLYRTPKKEKKEP